MPCRKLFGAAVSDDGDASEASIPDGTKITVDAQARSTCGTELHIDVRNIPTLKQCNPTFLFSGRRFQSNKRTDILQSFKEETSRLPL